MTNADHHVMQTTRGPTGPASSAPHKGRKRGGATSSLTRLYTLVFVTAGPLYLLWRATGVGTGWQLALSVPFLSIETWAWLQIICLRHQVSPGRLTDGRGRPNNNSDQDPASDTGDRVDGPTDVDAPDFDVVVAAGSLSTPADIERTLIGLAAAETRPVTVASTRHDVAANLPAQLTDQLSDLRFAPLNTENQAADALALVLHNSQADWVLWLDAGQVPMPNLAEAVAPHLSNERTAVCQIATGLLNPESLVQVGRDGDEEALEHELIGDAMAQRGRAPWHGPGSLIRKGAVPAAASLDDPQAFDVSWCAIELQRNGWEIAYESTPLIRVPAADSLRPYLSRRRDRSLAILEQLGYAFSLPNVPWAVRRTAMARAVSVTHGLRQLAMVAVLIGSLLSGRLPFAQSSGTTLALMAGYTGAAMLARRSLSGTSMALGDWVRHGWRTLGADLAALVPRLARPIELRRRRGQSKDSAVQLGLSGRLQLPIMAFGLLQVALAIRAFSVIQPMSLSPMGRGESLLAIMATTIITVQLIDVLGGITRPRGRRRSVRLPLKSDITVGNIWGQTLDVTPFGVGAIIEAAPPIGTTTSARFALNDVDGAERVVTVEGTVRSATHHRSGLVRVGLEFTSMDDADRLALTHFCALGVAGPGRSATAAAENPGRLPMERSTGDLVLVRSLAVASVLSAVGTLFVGPAADPVVAADNGVTAIPDSFAVTWPQPAAGTSNSGTNLSNELTVRLHTDDWSEALEPTDVETFSRPRGPSSWPGPVHLAVTVGPDRFVLLVQETTAEIELAALVVDDEVVVVELVGPGGVRFDGSDGQGLVPGRYSIRSQDIGGTTMLTKLAVDQGETIHVGPTGATIDGRQP